VFFGLKNRHNAGGGASRLSGPAPDWVAEHGSRAWQAWPRSAQKANRAWSEWLAAERAGRDRLYYCYVCAVAEEERVAAELQRIINPNVGALPGRDPIAAGSHTARPRDP
jgi:hypothetical protein